MLPRPGVWNDVRHTRSRVITLNNTPPTVQPGPQQPELSGLDVAPEPRWSLRPWLLAIIGLTVGYPLSFPFVLWFVASFAPMNVAGFVATLYTPIAMLEDRIPAVRAFFEWYFSVLGIMI